MQKNETTATFNEEVEKEDELTKPKLRIRFSLFFDGTLNNRSNINEREQFEVGTTTVTYKSEGDGGNNSYDNGRTNVAIMEPHIEKEQEGYHYTFKIYIEGQGTFNTGDEKERGRLDGKKGDSTLGYAGGSGESGVFKRAKKGYKKALLDLNTFLAAKDPAEYDIEKIDIDVFGFSRGAATARCSISVMLEDEEKPLKDHMTGKRYKLLSEDAIEVKFAGIYDTVVSVNGSQYSYWSDNKLNQRAVALAKKSLHLAAAEEHRQDFPLHTIKSAKDAERGKEYFLPGVHSDVGGSYNLANESLLDQSKDNSTTTYKTVIGKGSVSGMQKKKNDLVSKNIYLASDLDIEESSNGIMGFFPKVKLVATKTIHGKQYMRTSNEVDRIMNIGLLSSLEIDKQHLMEQGWYTEEEIDIATKQAVTATAGAIGGGLIAGPKGAALGAAVGGNVGVLIVNRSNIKSAYSNIPLKIMADYAFKDGELKINEKLKDRANIILKDEIFLGHVESAIESYIAEVGNNSKPEDWLEESKWTRSIDIQKLRHDHLHMSSKMAVGYFPRFENIKRRRYYYEG